MGPKNLSVYLEIADANGQLIIDQRDWRDSGIYGRCQYQFAVNQGNVEATALNEVESTSDNCHKRLPFTLERTDQDVPSLKLYPEMAALWEIGMLDLNPVVRPPLPADAYAPIENLDILGLTLEMELSEATAILEERGFAMIENRDIAYESFIAPTRLWGRFPAEDGKLLDRVLINYTLEGDGITGEPIATRIERQRDFTQADGMTQSAVIGSLEDKCGPLMSGTIRRWNRQGERTNELSCGEGTHVPIQSEFASINGDVFTEKLHVACGPILVTMVSLDQGTGLVATLSTTLLGVDGAWQEFWDGISLQMRAKLDAAYRAVTSGDVAVPEP